MTRFLSQSIGILLFEVPDMFLAQIVLASLERVSLAATQRFSYLAYMGNMKVDEVYKGSCARQYRIDPGLGLAGPPLSVVAANAPHSHSGSFVWANPESTGMGF